MKKCMLFAGFVTGEITSDLHHRFCICVLWICSSSLAETFSNSVWKCLASNRIPVTKAIWLCMDLHSHWVWCHGGVSEPVYSPSPAINTHTHTDHTHQLVCERLSQTITTNTQHRQNHGNKYTTNYWEFWEHPTNWLMKKVTLFHSWMNLNFWTNMDCM